MAAPDAPADLHRPDPRARTLWSVLSGGFGGVVGALLGVGAAVLGAWPAGIVLVAVGVATGVLLARAAWRRRTWALAPRSLDLTRGVVVQRATSIPYERIQQIDVQRGPLERLFGIAQLVVRTAAATTDADLHGLSPDDADGLRQRLLDLAGIDDVV